MSQVFRVSAVDTGEQLAGGDRREGDSRSGKGTCQEIEGELSPLERNEGAGVDQLGHAVVGISAWLRWMSSRSAATSTSPIGRSRNSSGRVR